MKDCVPPYVRVAPDASSGVARKARNESEDVTRRCAPRGGRGVRPYTSKYGLRLWRRDE
jgi:hypothetical protein